MSSAGGTAEAISSEGGATAERPCPVCGGRAVEPLQRLEFVVPDGFPLPERQTVVACRGCGMVYADVAARQEDYDTFYAALSRYEDPLSSTGSGATPADYERLEESAALLSTYVPAKEARLLDIGCAGGGLLRALQRRGYRQLAGLDPAPGCVRRLAEANLTAYQGLLTRLPPAMGVFDCVSLSHVLEHVLDVARALANLRSLVREGGLLYVEVPDARRYAEQVNAPSQDFNCEHINHFSLRCLHNALARYGYAPVASGARRLRSSAHTWTPAVYSVCRALAPGAAAPPLRPDTELAAAARDYFRRAGALMEQIRGRIEAALQQSPQLALWGCGQLTLRLLAETALARVKPVLIVDSNPLYHGRTLAGVPIRPPTALRACPQQPVLLATLLHQHEIAAQARALGLPNPLLLLPQPNPAAAPIP